MTTEPVTVRRMRVARAAQEAVTARPDVLTGVSARPPDGITVHLTDTAAAEQPPLAAVLEKARQEGITVTLAQVPRSSAELAAVTDAVRAHPILRIPACEGMSFGPDMLTGTVRVRVAAESASALREAFAEHGDALVVNAVPVEEGLTSFQRPSVPRPRAWPVPDPDLDEAAGWPVEDLAARYRDQGFFVVTHRYGFPATFTLDLRTDRIRLLARDGLVVDARQS